MTCAPVLVTYTYLRELESAELARIPPPELQRLAHIVARRRRQQYLCARALLRLTLERWTGDPAESHRLTTTEEGKPICVDGPAVSITHSGNLVACTVTEFGEIGIDLEVPGRQRDTADIARSYFSGEEACWLETQPEDRFYMLWVLKEACLKAFGRGLGGLNRLRCTVVPPRIDASIMDDTLEGLGLYAMGEAFLALAATRSPLETVAFERWDPGAEKLEASDGFRTIATAHDVTG